MNSGQEETEGHSLSKAILAGDPNAWGEFLSEYGDALRRVAEKHSRSAKLQSVVSWEDIFQGFFTDKLIAHKEGMFSATSRGEVPLKPRLLASLGNYCNDLYRRKLTLRNESTLDARVSQKAVDVFHYDEPRLIRRRIAEQQLAIRSTFQQNLRIQVPQQEILLLQERIWIAEQFAAFYCKGSDSKSEKDQGSSGVPGRSRQKSLNERIEECFPSFSSVVNELEEREVERQFLLRDAPMRT